MSVKKPIDLELTYGLAKLHCTNREIASLVGISVDTLQRRYHDILDKGRDEGKMTLRRSMWDLALNGRNPTMMIWLSKQHLGFSDNPIGNEDKKPLPWTDDDIVEGKGLAIAAEETAATDQEEVEIELTFAAHDTLRAEINSTFRTFGDQE